MRERRRHGFELVFVLLLQHGFDGLGLVADLADPEHVLEQITTLRLAERREGAAQHGERVAQAVFVNRGDPRVEHRDDGAALHEGEAGDLQEAFEERGGAQRLVRVGEAERDDAEDVVVAQDLGEMKQPRREAARARVNDEVVDE